MYGQRTIWLLFLSAGLAVILVCFLVWQQPERKALRFFDKHRTELAQTAQDWIQSGKIQFGSGVIVNVWDGEQGTVKKLEPCWYYFEASAA